jgi:hypothetical protein
MGRKMQSDGASLEAERLACVCIGIMTPTGTGLLLRTNYLLAMLEVIRRCVCMVEGGL